MKQPIPVFSGTGLLFVASLAMIGTLVAPVLAEIIPAQPSSAITSSGLNTQIHLSTLPPPGMAQYDITGGTRPEGGVNLFHSFGEFGVPTNSIANFLNDTGLPTSNILARVTGDFRSDIFGTIQTTGFGNANLFLMNPHGFLFGQNATVNVGGMVAFTSADYIRLTDNAQFNAIPNMAADALLTLSPVGAFGFLGSNPGAITVQGGQFFVADGQSISLVGGNISIDSGTETAQPTQLLAPNGKIQLASAASPGEFDTATLQPLPNMDGASFTSLGSVTLTPGSSVAVSGANNVSIRSGQLVLSVNDAVLSTAVTPDTADTIMLGNGSAILASTQGNSSSGDIDITAKTIKLNGSRVQTESLDPGIGDAGNITIAASETLLLFASGITSATSGSGAGGTISITGWPSVTLEDGSVFFTQTIGSNRAGDINLSVANLTMTSGSGIESVGSDSGSSGSMAINATDPISLSESGIVNRNEGFGGTGGIAITAKTLNLANSSFIRSDTFFALEGAATPEITILADDTVRVSSDSGIIVAATLTDVGAVEISSQSLTLSERGFIDTTTGGPGTAGAVTVNMQDLQVSSGGRIRSSTVQDSGLGGTITVMASRTVSVSGPDSGIFSDSSSPASTAQGGSIIVSAQQIEVTNGGAISAKTTLSGNAGDITLKASSVDLETGGQVTSSSVPRALFFEGDEAPLPTGNAGSVTIQGLASSAQSVLIDGTGSGIFTNTQGTGAGGNIAINANTVTLQNGGTLSAATSGTNNGGDIQVDATAINLHSFAFINTLSFFSDGSAGNIALKATQQITAVDSFLNTDAIGGTGLGGNILLRAPTISVNGGILSTSTSGTGRAGNILLEGQQISLGASPLGGPQGADLFAQTSGSGHGGTVTVRGPDGPSSHADNVTISGSSRFLTTTFSDGDAGDITINAAQFTLTSHATLNAESSGSGSAGTITTMATDSATISDFAKLNTDTGESGGTGNAGQITMSAPTVMIANGGSISTNTTGEGTGGNINIRAGQSVTMTNSSRVSASSSGTGNAGDIVINAGQNYTSTDSLVTTQATAPGTEASGGNITVLATDTVHLTNSQLNASVQGSSTTIGGNITIDPQYVILQNSQILAQATQGQGGAISLTITNGGLFLPDANSTVSASSQFGVNGTITIQSPNAPISGQIQPLNKTPLLSTSLLNQRCAALAGGQFSSFTVAGRDSLPTEPGSWLASPLYAAGVGLGIKAEEERLEGMSANAGRESDALILSLRQIAPAGFLTQTFAVDSSAGCHS